jgi:hypothetical protein
LKSLDEILLLCSSPGKRTTEIHAPTRMRAARTVKGVRLRYHEAFEGNRDERALRDSLQTAAPTETIHGRISAGGSDVVAMVY